MRNIEVSKECLEFINESGERVELKFYYLLEIMLEERVVSSKFVKKLIDTNYYELRISAGNEYRVILFTVNHTNFNECTEVICLNGFLKKSTKDYKKAIKLADKILENYK